MDAIHALFIAVAVFEGLMAIKEEGVKYQLFFMAISAWFTFFGLWKW